MIAYTRAKLLYLLKIDFIRFCIVGGTGFTINLIILVSLTKFFGLSTVVAQFIGAEVALFSNFLMHHHWTYKGHNVKKSLPALLIQFHATTWPAILGSTFMVGASVSIFHLSKLVALIISSAISLLWNFFWSKYVVWRKVTDKEVTSASL